VITDIFMPESDGLEVILEIKKTVRELSLSTPVIAVSGGMTMRGLQPISFLHQAETLGADRVFPKPLDFSGICRAIGELLPSKAHS
jgi:CheY-like chemotaxis protein